mgnify:CR=1 FL=1
MARSRQKAGSSQYVIVCKTKYSGPKSTTLPDSVRMMMSGFISLILRIANFSLFDRSCGLSRFQLAIRKYFTVLLAQRFRFLPPRVLYSYMSFLSGEFGYNRLMLSFILTFTLFWIKVFLSSSCPNCFASSEFLISTRSS